VRPGRLLWCADHRYRRYGWSHLSPPGTGAIHGKEPGRRGWLCACVDADLSLHGHRSGGAASGPFSCTAIIMAIFPAPIPLRSPRFLAVTGLVLSLGAIPLATAAIGAPFFGTLALRITIFWLAAASLNVVLGYGGLVSLGHALYLGLGAYAVAILSFHGVTNGWVHLSTTLIVSALTSFLTGLVCLR